jgi:hypothetical protein
MTGREFQLEREGFYRKSFNERQDSRGSSGSPMKDRLFAVKVSMGDRVSEVWLRVFNG